MGDIILLKVTLGVTWTQPICIYIYIYIYKSYTFFKPLDLSRSNGQKRHLLMLIFWLGSYLLFFIFDIPYLSLYPK